MGLVLDLRTIYIVSGTICLILGILQLAVYSTGRLGRWPLCGMPAISSFVLA